METGGNMENKVIAKEYVDKNYVHKDKIREKIEWIDKEGYLDFYTDRDITICCEILRELLEDK